eukprot:6460204-Amphidinium_carterae.1
MQPLDRPSQRINKTLSEKGAGWSFEPKDQHVQWLMLKVDVLSEPVQRHYHWAPPKKGKG